MDLIEAKELKTRRHPWEISKSRAISDIIFGSGEIRSPLRVADIGCGDVFISSELFGKLDNVSVTCMDVNLTDRHIERLQAANPAFFFTNKSEDISGGDFDLILMLDVIEHVPDDREFLKSIVDNSMNNGGTVLIAAPAFKSLFGSHDKLLKHYRRYDRKRLVRLAMGCGLTVRSCGYLFWALLPPRIFSVMYEKLFGAPFTDKKGLGAWSHGLVVTSIIAFFLNITNSLALFLSGFSVHLPGLTVWTLCQKQR